MKKLFFLSLLMVAYCFSKAAVSPASVLSLHAEAPLAKTPLLNANNIFVPVGNSGQTISLMVLSRISAKEFETLSGKKLGLFKRIGFKLAQKKLRNEIEADGTIRNKSTGNTPIGGSGFHLGGFALGFLLNVYGVIIAYFIKDDKKRARVKWAWIGMGMAFFLLFLIVLAIAGGKFR